MASYEFNLYWNGEQEKLIADHLNALCSRLNERGAYHYEKSLLDKINGACDLASVLGFQTDYNPITNTFSVKKGENK